MKRGSARRILSANSCQMGRLCIDERSLSIIRHWSRLRLDISDVMFERDTPPLTYMD